MADEKMIITIGREHGTMGDKVAEKIRRQFELPLYDKAHLLRIVEETDDYDELNAFFNDRKVNSLLYAIAMSENVSSNDVPFGIIKKIIGNTGGVDGIVRKLSFQRSSEYGKNFYACRQEHSN